MVSNNFYFHPWKDAPNLTFIFLKGLKPPTTGSNHLIITLQPGLKMSTSRIYWSGGLSQSLGLGLPTGGLVDLQSLASRWWMEDRDRCKWYGKSDSGMKIVTVNYYFSMYSFFLFKLSPSTCVFSCFVHLCGVFDLYKQLDSPRSPSWWPHWSIINHQPSSAPSWGLCLDLQHYWSLSTSKPFRATKMWMYRSEGPSNWGEGDTTFFFSGLEDSVCWGSW